MDPTPIPQDALLELIRLSATDSDSLWSWGAFISTATGTGLAVVVSVTGWYIAQWRRSASAEHDLVARSLELLSLFREEITTNIEWVDEVRDMDLATLIPTPQLQDDAWRGTQAEFLGLRNIETSTFTEISTAFLKFRRAFLISQQLFEFSTGIGSAVRGSAGSELQRVLLENCVDAGEQGRLALQSIASSETTLNNGR